MLYVIAGPHGGVAREPVNLHSPVEEEHSTGSAGENCFLPKVLGADALSQSSMASVRCDYLSTTYLLDGISVQVINQYPELLGDVHGFLQLAPIIFSLELHQSLKRNKNHDQKVHQWSFHQAGFRRRQDIGTANPWKTGNVLMSLSKCSLGKNEIRWHDQGMKSDS